MGVDGATESVEGVGLDGDSMFDGLVGMSGVAEIHRVLGRDDPMGRCDAAVGGADGDAPVAQRPRESDTSPAGDALIEFFRIGQNPRPNSPPSLQYRAIHV